MMQQIEKKRLRPPRRKLLLTGLTVAMALSLAVCAWGCADAGFDPSAGSQADGHTEFAKENDEAWAAYLPRVVTNNYGQVIQKTPYANTPYGTMNSEDWPLYNTYVLDADHRGCSSCHDLRDALEDGIWHQVSWFGNYPNSVGEFNSASSCFVCHELGYGVNMRDFAHAHMNWPAFKEMGGNCNSCHYIDENNNTLLWDDVKYDVLAGFTDIDADSANMTVDWNQDELTPRENMYFEAKAVENYDGVWVERSDDILNTYSISWNGDVENPCEMTLQEMIDKFGTETRVQASHCVLDGVGGTLIYQAEVTGIPVKKVLEYVKPQANACYPTGVDGFTLPIWNEHLEDALIVYEMNGEPLPDHQGYPCAIWFGESISAGSYVRYLSEMNFTNVETDIDTSGMDPVEAGYLEAQMAFLDGAFVQNAPDPDSGYAVALPNIQVLSSESGRIFKAGETVHLEGYSHGYNEVVTKLEFSLDHGATWREVPIENMDTMRWVYWKMDLEDLDPGSYLLKMRATSLDWKTGEPHSTKCDVNYVINVQ